MSVEREDNLDFSKPRSSSSDNSLMLRLQKTLISCTRSIEGGDRHESDRAVSELVNFLDSITDSVAVDPENEVLENNAFEILVGVHQYICSSSLGQAVIDELSSQLPKEVAKFSGVSNKCLEIVDSVIDHFIVSCSPRDMLSFLCEALESPGQIFKVPGYFAPLLSGISKVFLLIQRRQLEQAKAALPVVLKVLMFVSFEPDNGDLDFENLFERAISIADSLQTTCEKLDGRINKELCALLGLYVLQIMALVSISMGNTISNCLPLVLRLSHLFQFCHLTYLGSITGSDIDEITGIVPEEDGDDYMNNFPYVKHGACLAVIWGHFSSEIVQAAGEDLCSVKYELQINQAKRWQAVGMLRHLFSAVNLPWELKKQGIDFLLCIMANISRKCNECVDFASYVLPLSAALQAFEWVLVFAPDIVTRRNAYGAVKRVLADIPDYARFDIIKALIINSNSSSWAAILVDHVREELRLENCPKIENESCQNTKFWGPGVLALVEFVLRPPEGGPPSLPEDSDAVLSILNLYRFVLITESTGKTNYTGVLSKDNLYKANKDWLQPLLTLVTGIEATSNKDCDHQHAIETVCAINPVEAVLYRCIELVEEKLKDST